MRINRQNDELRPIEIIMNYQKNPKASILWCQGNTKVIVAVSVEEEVPRFMKGQGRGWLTAEYSLLPSSTGVRNDREAAKGRQSGRTMEIQRLIGRSLRQAVDLDKLGELTIKIDCDVIDADGGTRTASVSGAYLALVMALKRMQKELNWQELPLKNGISAVSVGIVNGEAVLDLDYREDSKAEVDMNLVMTHKGTFVELQGTGEESDFTPDQLSKLLELGKKGIAEIDRIVNEKIEGLR